MPFRMSWTIDDLVDHPAIADSKVPVIIEEQSKQVTRAGRAIIRVLEKKHSSLSTKEIGKVFNIHELTVKRILVNQYHTGRKDNDNIKEDKKHVPKDLMEKLDFLMLLHARSSNSASNDSDEEGCCDEGGNTAVRDAQDKFADPVQRIRRQASLNPVPSGAPAPSHTTSTRPSTPRKRKGSIEVASDTKDKIEKKRQKRSKSGIHLDGTLEVKSHLAAAAEPGSTQMLDFFKMAGYKETKFIECLIDEGFSVEELLVLKDLEINTIRSFLESRFLEKTSNQAKLNITALVIAKAKEDAWNILA